MVRAAPLAAIILLVGSARAADFQPLEVTATPWVSSVGSIVAAPGTMPSRLSGMSSNGIFVDASVEVVGGALVIHFSGNAPATVPQSGVIIRLGPSDIMLLLPESPQSVIQVFADFAVTASADWTAVAYAVPTSLMTADHCDVAIDALGGIVGDLDPKGFVPPGANQEISALTLPSGESARFKNCFFQLELRPATNATPGPFNATATLRFRFAKPLALGDVDASGQVNLVDSVILRRQLVGAPVP